MSSDRRPQRPKESFHDDADDWAQYINSQDFNPSENRLASTLELLRSYQTVLRADVYLTRLFGIPLASDAKASGLSSLFSTREPSISEVELTDGNPVQWVDVLRSPMFNPDTLSFQNAIILAIP